MFVVNAQLPSHVRQYWKSTSESAGIISATTTSNAKKNLVFKHLGGLIEHVIVKQSEGEDIGSDGTKWKQYKSGILVTCKSQVESTQLKEGKHVLCMPRKEKVEAAKKRAVKKEEIINEGLQIAIGNPEAPKVKLEFEYKKHEDDGRRKCKWCDDRTPYSNEYCPCRNPNLNWQLLNR